MIFYWQKYCDGFTRQCKVNCRMCFIFQQEYFNKTLKSFLSYSLFYRIYKSSYFLQIWFPSNYNREIRRSSGPWSQKQALHFQCSSATHGKKGPKILKHLQHGETIVIPTRLQTSLVHACRSRLEMANRTPSAPTGMNSCDPHCVCRASGRLRVRSLPRSYQRLEKWYPGPHCLALSDFEGYTLYKDHYGKIFS